MNFICKLGELDPLYLVPASLRGCCGLGFDYKFRSGVLIEIIARVKYLFLMYKVKVRNGDGIFLFCVHFVRMTVLVQFYYGYLSGRKTPITAINVSSL